jgi:glycosyltransferase involved in cell wall biosynthesis
VKILFIAEGLDRPEAHVMAGLAGRGAEISLFLPPGQPTPEVLTGRVMRRDVPLKSRMDRASTRIFREFLREEEVDVIHCLRGNRPLATLLPALRPEPLPGRASPRLVAYRGIMGNISRWNPGAWMTYLHQRVDRIVCVCDAVRHSLLDAGLPSGRLVTIYKGHDPAWYRDQAPPDLTSLGIPRGAFVVGCAAQMRPRKGIDVLIRSIDHLTPSRPVHYLLIGDRLDPLIDKLAARAPYRDLVHPVGYRKDAAALSGACDVCVMPSLRREGLPRSVIEAMCQAVPAVVTRVGGMPELVADGESGLVVPPNDPAAMGVAISRFANDAALYARCAKGALDRIRSAFNVEGTVERTWALYEELVPATSHPCPLPGETPAPP